ncbi:ribonuclease R [Candidatus Sumerlaeota bacterium]|nr:ribonuclease R [Candidatus Sumerlaeota bacterium]
MFDESKIIKAIRESRSPVNLVQLSRQFGVRAPDRRAFRKFLRELEERGEIARVSGKNYSAPSGRSSQILGRLEVTSKGFGFVRPDWSSLKGKPPFSGDLFIAQKDLGEGLDGDLVRAEVMRRADEGPTGRIVDVLEHAHKKMVGWYQAMGRNGDVMPRNKRMDRRVRVPLPAKELGVGDFDWVEVEIDKFTPAPEPLQGHIVARIGSDEDKGIDVLLLLRDRGIVEEFPSSVENEVKMLGFRGEVDLKGRQDYRNLVTITIDPKTAKDYDDALSINKRPGGGWELFVHIADVTHFLRQGTALDNEALERATSVYPVDRVVPMLPHKLSNDLCSLVPHEDRLTMTAVMEIGTDGQLLSKRVHTSVINSNHRLTYEQVQSSFDETDGKQPTEPTAFFQDVMPAMKELRACARALRRARFERGALDLDIPQLQVVFAEDGSVADLRFYPRYEAHQLVEECMLIANEAVAQYLTEKDVPLLYRIHEVADEDRLEKIIPALKVFGIGLGRGGKKIRPRDLQQALAKAQEHPAGHIVRRLILRALKRAEYNPENAGHFGLASDCYCHFTSPIRRYPDVVVHRQVRALEEGITLPYPREDNNLEELGEHTSQRERRAQEAEWESTTIKALEFMKRHEGDEFDAYVSGLQTWGVYVELEQYPVEGMMKKASLTADYYELDETGVKYVGKNTGHTIKLADKIRIRIDKIEPLEQRMDVTLLDQPERALGCRGRTGRRGGADFTRKGKGGPKKRRR